MNTPEDFLTNDLIEDSEYYAEHGYCITPEELIKEANNSIIKLTKLLKEFLVLGERHTFNDMKPKTREDFLHLFGKIKSELNHL